MNPLTATRIQFSRTTPGDFSLPVNWPFSSPTRGHQPAWGIVGYFPKEQKRPSNFDPIEKVRFLERESYSLWFAFWCWLSFIVNPLEMGKSRCVLGIFPKTFRNEQKVYFASFPDLVFLSFGIRRPISWSPKRRLMPNETEFRGRFRVIPLGTPTSCRPDPLV